MAFTSAQINDIVASFPPPDRSRYPELEEYTRDELYDDLSGGGGLYLAARMVRTMQLQRGDIVLDLGCGKGSTSVFLAKHFGVHVVAVDLWTPATFLDQKFSRLGYRDRIVPLHLDVTQELPFAEGYFDSIFCMNSFNFYGDSVELEEARRSDLQTCGHCEQGRKLSAQRGAGCARRHSAAQSGYPARGRQVAGCQR